MGKLFKSISAAHRDFIARQRIFFTGSAAEGTRINISPRSTNAFRVLGSHSVAYSDLTGSGNETAAHLRADGRLTIMFCAFKGPPSILRLYGRGTSHFVGTDGYHDLMARHFGGDAPRGTRQIVRLDVELVQTSCGYAVPLFSYEDERHGLERWTAAKSDEELVEYQRKKNTVSLDGLPTGLFADEKTSA